MEYTKLDGDLNTRGGGNTARDGDCEAVGEDTFPYFAAILFLSMIARLPSRIHLQRLLSCIALAKVEHPMVRKRVLILM